MRVTYRAGLFVALTGAWAGAGVVAAVSTAILSGNSARAETFEQAFAVQPHGRGILNSESFGTRPDVARQSDTRVAQFFPFFSPAQQPRYQVREPQQQMRRYPAKPAREYDRRNAEEQRRAYEQRKGKKRREAVGRERMQDGDQYEASRTGLRYDERNGRRRKIGRRVPAESHKDRIAAMLRTAPAAEPTKGPLLLAVSIARQTITLFDGGVPVAQGPVSTGTESRPTPMGVFSVLEKAWWHRSNMYSAAPMPFMQRITWSGVAIHSGELPGYRASHGCVRTTESFALKLWYATRIGARVVVSWDEISPLEISHPLLFQPKPGALPGALPGAQPPVENAPPPAPTEPYDGVIGMKAPPVLSDQFELADLSDDNDADGTVASNDDPVLDHMMNAAADDGAGTYDEHLSRRQLRALAAAEAPSPLRLEAAQEEANLGLTLPQVPEQSLALASLWDRNHAGPRLPLDAFEVARRTAKRVRHKTAHEPPPPPQYTFERVLRPGPISVLVSRHDNRIYVRKGMEPLFDAPVSIAHPDRPMGTHVFTAEGPTNDGGKLRWTVVSPSTRPVRRTDISTAAARAALDRIALPDSAVARIDDLMSTGATLIVTDAGLGRTAQTLDSDFTVLLR